MTGGVLSCLVGLTLVMVVKLIKDVCAYVVKWEWVNSALAKWADGAYVKRDWLVNYYTLHNRNCNHVNYTYLLDSHISVDSFPFSLINSLLTAFIRSLLEVKGRRDNLYWVGEQSYKNV